MGYARIAIEENGGMYIGNPSLSARIRCELFVFRLFVCNYKFIQLYLLFHVTRIRTTPEREAKIGFSNF